MKRTRYIIYILLLWGVILTSCKKEVEVLGGTFKYNDKEYSINQLRIENNGQLEENKYLLHLTISPSTYKYSEASQSGYGTIIDLYFTYPKENIKKCNITQECYSNEDEEIFSRVITISEEQSINYKSIKSIRLSIKDSTDRHQFYQFTLTLANDKTIEGSYLGNHVYNYTTDREAFGSLAFDTIDVTLAQPVMWKWDSLYSNKNLYYELVFYSTESRFRDNGSIINGTQFSVGFFSTSKKYPQAGNYPLADNKKANTALIGYKNGNTAWGSYWQVFKSGSAIGRANIVSGEIVINEITNEYINISYNLTDQLKNSVIGDYAGPYSIEK